MARADVLVSAQWAQENLDTPGVIFVEVDEDTSVYDTGHIPGAVKLDWKTDLQDAVIRDFVDAQQFSKLLSERGIGKRHGPFQVKVPKPHVFQIAAPSERLKQWRGGGCRAVNEHVHAAFQAGDHVVGRLCVRLPVCGGEWRHRSLCVARKRSRPEQ